MNRVKPQMLFFALIALACCASIARSQVLETQNGRLEFVGLEHWDIATIAQSLRYDVLEDFSCNVRRDLTSKLGFADAHCASYAEGGRPYRVITVLEPESAARIRYLPEPAVSFASPRAWTELLKLVEEEKLLNTVLDYGSTFANAATKETLMPAEDEQWFVWLRARRSEEDFVLALDRLARDGDYKNRSVAAMVLTNFAERDLAWYALTRGLRDANEVVRAVCLEALLTLVNYAPRNINWSPAASDLNALLSGTNLFAYARVVEILLATAVSPKLAQELLKGQASELLFAYLRASHHHEREIAHHLLAQLSAKDFGYDGQRWRDWLALLRLRSNCEL